MTPTTTTDLQPYSAEVAAIAAKGAELQTQAEAFVITSDEDDLNAKTVLATVRDGLKQAEARRKEVKAPHLAKCNEIDTAFKTALTPWGAADKAIAAKTGAYYAEQKRLKDEQRGEAERLEREAAAARRLAEEEAAAYAPVRTLERCLRCANELPADHDESFLCGTCRALVAVPAPIAATTKTDAGDVGMVRQRGYQIVDEAQIPREYLVIDRVLIGKTYRAGGDVPGCKEDITYVPRTR